MYMRLICILSLFLFTMTLPIHGQRKKTLFLDKIDTICTNTKVDFNVRAKNFTNIGSFQGSIGWDSSILAFDSLMYGYNTGSLNLNDSNTSIQSTNSSVSFIWSDSFARTIPDSTILFTIHFSIINPKGNRTSVYFNRQPANNNYTALEIDTLHVINPKPIPTYDTSFVDGYISFVDSPKIFQNGNILTCIASCNPSSFQWYFNGEQMVNDTSNSILIKGTGSYTVLVSYSNGIKLYSSVSNITLPIEIQSFDASFDNNVTTIKWRTIEELGASYYNLGRKLNEGNYQTITTINAKGTVAASEYEYLDKDKNRGVISYQLEVVDKDGSKHYSRIVSVNPKSELNYTIFPNLSNNQVKIEGENISQIDVLDNTGRLYSRRRYAVLSKQSFSAKIITTKELLPGLYFIKIYNLDKSSKIEKLVVN